MTAQEMAVLLWKADGNLEVEICGYPLESIAVFGGKLNIDCAHLALDDADQVIYQAQKETQNEQVTF
jgi:hypothetical protein